jgi:DNA-directed RNA polymerase specialized sigma24 family protein
MDKVDQPSHELLPVGTTRRARHVASIAFAIGAVVLFVAVFVADVTPRTTLLLMVAFVLGIIAFVLLMARFSRRLRREERETASVLQTREQEFQQMAGNIQEIFWVIDADFHYCRWRPLAPRGRFYHCRSHRRREALVHFAGGCDFVSGDFRILRPRNSPRNSSPLEIVASVWPGCDQEIPFFVLTMVSMACPGRTLAWWDRELDQAGRTIRPDVRSAAHDIWDQACQQTMAIVADHAPAAELMENTVAQVSRYLDRIGAPVSSRKHGLLLVAYCRALRRYAVKANRLEPVGGSAELAMRMADLGSMRQADGRLALDGVVRELSQRNRDVLSLRAAGYEWKEIAQVFGMSVPAIRNGFWREIGRLRCRFSTDLA